MHPFPVGPLGVIGALGWLGEHWRLIAPLVLGAVALAQLLPHGFKRPVPQALALGIISLLAAWGLWVHSSPSTLYSFLFAAFASLSIIAAVAMVVQNNPVYAALCFALCILGTCGLFLLLTAPFLAAATIIVYAGAIIVMFLFVIMLAQQSGRATYDRFSHAPIRSTIAGFFFLGALLYSLEETYISPTKKADEDRRIAAVDQILAEIDDAKAKLSELSGGAAKSSNEKSIPQVLQGLADELPGTTAAAATKERLSIVLRDWETGVQSGRLPERLDQLHDSVVELRDRFVKTGETGFLRPRPERETPLDHAKVSLLGESLFGEYLWGVEMAGTLLLVAVVGAISIAPNRAEGNR